MKKQMSNARGSSIHLFSGIVKENHGKMASLGLQMERLKGKLTRTKGEDESNLLEQEINSLQDDLAKSSSIVIVFSAMAIEAYIYDYAARHFGDNFVKDNLDKLDTISKWIVIPKLITGRDLPRQQKWFELKLSEDVIRYVVDETAFIESQCKKALQHLENSSEIAVEDRKTDGSKRKKTTFPPGVVIHF